MNESQSWSLPSLNVVSADLTNFAWYVDLIVSIESLPSQRRKTMQPQQLMLLSSQYSELSQQKQPQMIADVLMCTESLNELWYTKSGSAK